MIMDRLINAEAFKKILQRWIRGHQTADSKRDIEGLCKAAHGRFLQGYRRAGDRRCDPDRLDPEAGRGLSGNGERNVGQAAEAVGEGEDIERTFQRRGDGMSDIKDLIEIILVALACPFVLPVIIDEAEGETE